MFDDTPAEDISRRLHERHMLFGFIAETTFNLLSDVAGTSGNADSALWTGTYLAAEAFHYKVTGAQQAWDDMYDALVRVKDLSFVAPTGYLARTIFPTDSPFTRQIVDADGHNGLFLTTYRGVPSYWMGHHTRDQYCGVLLGLAVTYDLIDGGTDPEKAVRAICRDTIVHLVDCLINNNWKTTNPDGSQSESFYLRPAHLLSALSVARHVDSGRFGTEYVKKRNRWWRLAGFWSWIDTLLIRSKYFYMNLDHCYYYKLIEYEDDATFKKRFRKQFSRLRHATRDHQNAHFNMIDRAVNGKDDDRDRQTVSYLKALLDRGFRNDHIQGDGESRAPVPVADRPYEDFLWQRAPFAFKAPGDGMTESPGVDYILPYWMARHFKVIT